MSSPRLLCIRGGRRPITALSGSSQGAAAGQGLLELARPPPPPPLLCGQRFRGRLRSPRGTRFVRRGLSAGPAAPGRSRSAGLEAPEGAAAAGLPAHGGRRRRAGWRRGCPCGLGSGFLPPPPPPPLPPRFFFPTSALEFPVPRAAPRRCGSSASFPTPGGPLPAVALNSCGGERGPPRARRRGGGLRAPSPGATAGAAPPRGRQRTPAPSGWGSSPIVRSGQRPRVGRVARTRATWPTTGAASTSL